MRIHILSDLHQEIGGPYAPAVRDADLTILAGDIHTKERGPTWADAAFSGMVVYIPGNHEFWGGHLTRTVAKLKEAQTDRVKVLQRDVLIIGDIRILGATGWTDYTLTGNPPLATWVAGDRMNDFRKIRYSPEFRRLTPHVTQAEAFTNKRWLQEQLSIPFAGKTIVVTHHAPCPLSLRGIPSEGDLDASYANNWQDELFGDTVQLWVHGHTHNAVDYELYGTRVIANPHGYPGENIPGFRKDLILEL